MKSIIECVLVALLLTSIVSSTIPTPKAQQYPREETLIQGYNADRPDPSSWNSEAPGQWYNYFPGMSEYCYEELFYVNIYTGEWIPWLATSLEYNQDFTVLTTHLRQGVTWSDGQPFTADDCVFTYHLFLDSPQMLVHSPQIRAAFKSVTKIDDYTFSLELKSPNPRVHNIMGTYPASGGGVFGYMYIVPKHIWEPYFNTPIEFKNSPPIGTGPYTVVTSDRTRAVWQRRDDYWATEMWGIRPSVKYIIYLTANTEEVIAMQMVNNELDSIGWGTPASGTAASMVSKNSYITGWIPNYPYTWLDVGVRCMRLNWLKYPWNIPEARRGLSYLIDRQQVVNIALDGAGHPSLWFTDSAVVQTYLDAISDLMTKYEPLAYNVDKANAIFTSLGWTKGGDGIWVTDNGTRVTCEIVAWVDHIPDVKIGTVVTSNLMAGGIDATFKPQMPATLEQYTQTGLFTAAIHLSINTIEPLVGVEDVTTAYLQPVGVMSYNNRERYNNPALDVAVENMRTYSPTTQLPQVLSAWHDVMDIILGQTVVIPLCQYPLCVLVNTKYWVNFPTQANPYCAIANWWTSALFWVTGFANDTGQAMVEAGTKTIDQVWYSKVVRPRTYDNMTVQFTGDMSKWKAINGVWYGPFNVGDKATVPADDAEWLIRNNWAKIAAPATTPPATTPPATTPPATTPPATTPPATTPPATTPPPPPPVDYTLYAVIAVVVIIIIVAIVLLMRRK